MKKNEIDIVIALSPEGVFRLDMSDGKLHSLRQRSGGLAEALANALRLSRVRRSARVLVLSSDFFSQTVRLPHRQIAGLSATEIETALAYEIEPFSNIVRENGIAAFLPMTESSADTASWRAVQIARSDWDSLDAAARRTAGARLVGCAPLDPLPVGDDEIAAALMRVAADAQSTPPRIPVAAMASSSANSQTLPMVALSLFVIVVLAISIYGGIAKRNLAALRADVEKREALAATNNRIANEIRSVEARRGKIKQDMADRDAAADSLLAYRKAWSALLRDLSNACGADVMIRSISGDINAGGVEVEAIATDVDAPASCMVRIAELAAKNGWKLTPRDVRNEPKGPSSFRFALEFKGGAK